MRFNAVISLHRRRVPRLLSRLFKLGYVLAGVAALFAAWRSSPFGEVAALLTVAGYPLLIASFIMWLVAGAHEGEVTVTDAALLVSMGGKAARVIPRREIESALLVRRIVPAALWATVEIGLRGGDRLDVRIPDGETAEALVRELGFGADGARLHVDLAQPSRRLLHIAIAFALNIGTSFLSGALLLVTFSGFYTATRGLMPLLQLALFLLATKAFSAPKVVVGRDGVLVERGFTKKLYRADDPVLPSALQGVGVDVARAGEVLRAARERVGAGKPIASLFQRGGLSLAAWRARIVAGMDGGYRTSGNVPDLARAVLASSDVTPDERVGAALALRVAGDLGPVRIAADATADERVRIVLDSVAAGADDAIVEKQLRKTVLLR